MKSLRMIPVAILLLALIPGFSAAQSGHDLLQRALQQERIFGNLKEAIQLYQRIALEHTEDRALAATALLNLAGACEKLGMPEARDAYQRVLEEYPDQEGQARNARSRLEALTGSTETERSGSGGQDPTLTLLMDDGVWHHPSFGRRFDLSPDGQQMVFPSFDYGPPGIYLMERLGDRPRLIYEVPKGFIGRRGGMPRWSPDGSMIAVLDLNIGRQALIIDRAGNVITRVPLRVGSPTDLAWNPDQQGITYTSKSAGVRSVTLDGQETLLAETEGGIWTFAGYSPDGRWIAYTARGLWVFPATGGTPRRVGPHVMAPVWGPDGAIYGMGNRSGYRNAYRMEMDLENGDTIGEPEQLTFYRDAEVIGMAVARDAGTMAYVLTRGRSTVWTAHPEQLDAPRGLVRGTDPMLSPDGTRVFFTGQGPGSDGIYSVPITGGAPRRLTPESHSIWGGSGRTFLWPDGSRIGYQAALKDPESTTRPERQFFVISTEGGDPAQLPIPSNAYTPSVSPDGSTLAYALPEAAPGSGVENHELYLLPVEGGEPILRAELPAVDVYWSPDGRNLAAVHYNSADDTYQIHVLPVDGGEPRFLMNESMEWKGPGVSWHPDGDRLSYVRKDTIWVAYIDGRAPTPFYYEPDLDTWGGWWSADGETFFSEGFGPDDWDVYRRNPDGSSEFLWAGGIPLISADGQTWVWDAGVRNFETWLMENFR